MNPQESADRWLTQCDPDRANPRRYDDGRGASEGLVHELQIEAGWVGEEDRVLFLQADVFSWRPERRHDVVFFGFCLSHVARERFEAFWSLVDACLQPSGRVFFVDDAFRTPDELVEGESSSTIERRLRDGAAHRLVKVPYVPAELEQALASLGWQFTVTQTAEHFYWGAGCRSAS
jgi:hypothetical protein